MRDSIVYIEIGSDAKYSAYMSNDWVNYNVHGIGDTVSEAKKDFYTALEEMKETFEELEKPFEELNFIFKYDIQSFFNYYSQVFTMPALERLTGINQKQLHHYASGLKKPRRAQIDKLQHAMHKLGASLQQIQF